MYTSINKPVLFIYIFSDIIDDVIMYRIYDHGIDYVPWIDTSY